MSRQALLLLRQAAHGEASELTRSVDVISLSRLQIRQIQEIGDKVIAEETVARMIGECGWPIALSPATPRYRLPDVDPRCPPV
jgi:hypothetical protein